MIFAFILIAILLILALILFTNIKIKIKYYETFNIDFYFGWFKIPQSLFEKKEKEKKPENEVKNDDKTKNDKPKNKFIDKIKQKGIHQSFLEVIEFLSPVLKEVESFLKRIKIDPLKIDIKMVGDDAAKLAIDYGKFCAVYYPIIELIDSKTKCKNINSNVYVDYVDKSPSIYIKTELKFRLVFGIISGLKIVNLFLKLKEKFK